MAIPHFTTLDLKVGKLLVVGPVLDDQNLTGHVFHYAIVQGDIVHRGMSTEVRPPDTEGAPSTWKDHQPAPDLGRGPATCYGASISYRTDAPKGHIEIFTWAEEAQVT